MTDTATQVTWGDLRKVFEEVGVRPEHVTAGDNGPRIDIVRGVSDERLAVLVVSTYALDDKGMRYWGSDGKVATETRRFFIGSFGGLTPCTVVQHPRWDVKNAEGDHLGSCEAPSAEDAVDQWRRSHWSCGGREMDGVIAVPEEVPASQ